MPVLLKLIGLVFLSSLFMAPVVWAVDSKQSVLAMILSQMPPTQILAQFPPQDFESERFVTLLKDAEQVAAKGPSAFRFDLHGNAYLVVGNREYTCGRMSTPSLKELKASLLRPIKPTIELKLTVMLGSSPITDIRYLESHADGQTLFQLASQFNTLEAPTPILVPVQAYIHDRTQGPLGVLPVFPGALLRHYAAPIYSGTYQAQTQQVNLLRDVLPSEIGMLENGYLLSQNIQQPDQWAQILSDHFEQIRIGWHENLQVIDSSSRLSQVLVSTLAGGYYSKQATAKEPWLTIQRQLLRAAYLGTLLAAIRGEQHSVILTALGGGVFANPHELIWESIIWAMTQVQPWATAPLHVIVNLRNFDVAATKLDTDAKAWGGKLIKLGTL